jgi:poly(glycerol-phosphate) alpha-glucosyltransferase
LYEFDPWLNAFHPDSAACVLKDGQLVAAVAEERREMGRRGRQLIEDRYAWLAISRQMGAVYEWMLGTGPKPGCVIEAK